MKKVEIKIVNEALPFLVKGMSLKDNEEVIGFPYVHMVQEGDNVNYANIILVPDETGEKAFVQHPILGQMYRYSHKNEDGEAVFEDTSIEDEAVAEATKLSNGVGDDIPEPIKKLIMITFFNGVKWASEHGVTVNNFKKDDKK